MRTPVESSHIAALDYDGKTLEVDFRNGTRYRYTDVDPEIYQALLDSPSKGSYLRNVIKPSCPGQLIPVDETE